MADKAQGDTWVLVLPSSKHMFEKLGFVEVASKEFELDLKSFGGRKADGRQWLMKREPQLI